MLPRIPSQSNCKDVAKLARKTHLMKFDMMRKHGNSENTNSVAQHYDLSPSMIYRLWTVMSAIVIA